MSLECRHPVTVFKTEDLYPMVGATDCQLISQHSKTCHFRITINRPNHGTTGRVDDTHQLVRGTCNKLAAIEGIDYRFYTASMSGYGSNLSARFNFPLPDNLVRSAGSELHSVMAKYD